MAPWAEEEASGDAVQTWAAAAEAPMAAGVETSASPESCPEEARLLSNALAALSKSDAKRAEATSSSTGPGPGPGAGPGLNGGPGPLFGDHDHAPLPSTVVTKPVAEARALLAQINQLPEVLGSESLFDDVSWGLLAILGRELWGVHATGRANGGGGTMGRRGGLLRCFLDI